MKRRNLKYVSLLELLILTVILVVVNWMGNYFFYRLDLTQEKRFTLSSTTRKLAGRLDDRIICKVYLEGKLTANYKRLRIAVSDYLNELNQYSKTPVEYTFIDPLEGLDEKAQRDVIEQFLSKGLVPKRVKVQGENELAYQVIFPCAVFNYKDKEIPVNFMRNEQIDDEARNMEDINQAIENIEFEFANVLRKCVTVQKKKLAFLIGHGELGKYETGDIISELGDFYSVERLDITANTPERLNEYAGLIIARPTEKFSEFDKYKIDQYVMNGGKVLWLIDNMIADMDSTRNKELSFTSIPYDLNLEDILFRYGVRINNDLVQSLDCNVIPILANTQSQTKNRTVVPWPYFPLLGSYSQHPVVKNIDLVWGQFCSSIDTTSSTRCRKTILLSTTPRTRLIKSPAFVDLKMINEKIPSSSFNHPGASVAVLLEGAFESVFAKRKITDTVSRELKYIENIANNKMIVVSDGDIIRNQVSRNSGQVYPLGFDRYSGQTYGNKKFILNCVDFLCDDSGILELRNREIALRLLNKDKVKEERTQWQLINILVPILIVIIFAALNNFVRKRKYAA
jgi:ABC-2 type transport system permease protein